MTNKEALELALITLERDNLKVGNIYVNYDIQKALIKLVKNKLEKKQKKKWVGLTEEEMLEAENGCSYMDAFELTLYAEKIEAKLKEKNCG